MSLCEICQENKFKYKCPKCRSKYCTVACFKTHKEAGCLKIEETVQIKSPPETNTTPVLDLHHDGYGEVTEDKVPEELLERLGQSSAVLTTLENPHLQNMMRELDSSSTPDEAIHRAMQEPIFVEFADACLGVVQTDDANG